MKRNFEQAMENRRTYYTLTNASPISDDEIRRIIESAVKYMPSAFNSQSTRVVLLLGESHRKLWEITKDVLRGIVPESAFGRTEDKINRSFARGYGTVLFYEDMDVIEGLKKSFPTYADNMLMFSDHTSGMHQFAIWTMLEDAGLGASLQHYNPLIDKRVSEEWNISPKWRLIAQMPFGVAAEPAGEKEFKPLDERVKVYF